jgi:hypothetical protein
VKPETNIVRSAPYFPVHDVSAAVRYYETVLGFQQEYSVGTPAIFAIVSRDGFPLMLRLVAQPIAPNEKQGGTWDAFFWVRDAELLCADLKSRNASIVYGPIIQSDYNMKEFAVRDLNGYVLGFGQSL